MLSGLAYDRSSIARTSLSALRDHTAVDFVREIDYGDRHWIIGSFRSGAHLGGRRQPAFRKGFYFYPFQLYVTAHHVAVFSLSKRAAEAIVDDVLGRLPRSSRALQYRVGDIVADVLATKLTYWLSAVSVLVNAEATGLQRISFLGPDVARAPLFRDNKALYTTDSCGLRDPVTEEEIARIQGAGRLQVALSAPARVTLDDFDRTLPEARARVEEALNAILQAYVAAGV